MIIYYYSYTTTDGYTHMIGQKIYPYGMSYTGDVERYSYKTVTDIYFNS